VHQRVAWQIADFGLAKMLVNQTRMSTVCGTWAYSAPEVRIFRQMYDNKVDIWSLGVIMFTMYVLPWSGAAWNCPSK
jgi:serine/threonine protein kinase